MRGLIKYLLHLTRDIGIESVVLVENGHVQKSSSLKTPSDASVRELMEQVISPVIIADGNFPYGQGLGLLNGCRMSLLTRALCTDINTLS